MRGEKIAEFSRFSKIKSLVGKPFCEKLVCMHVHNQRNIVDSWKT